MPLESGTTIAQLDQNWPAGTDDVNRGDDHLRLIKKVLKLQFPGANKQGFSKPITATEDEINAIGANKTAIDDKIKTLEQQLNNIVHTVTDAIFPVGHLLITTHKQDPATLGYAGVWSQVPGEAALRIVTEGAGTTSGDDEVAVPVPEHAHTMSHTHERGTMDINGYFYVQATPDLHGAFYNPGGSLGDYSYLLYSSGGHTVRNKLGFQASKSWTGHTSQPNNANTGNTGTAGVKINVSGKCYKVYVYKRVS